MPKGCSRAHISNRIAYWRERRGLTQQELADLVHVHRNTVAGWESGAHAPLPELRQLIARALKRPESDIFLA